MTSTKPQKNQESAKTYLDYIDKEMTFCGIITTFSLACVLFSINKMFGKDDGPLHIEYNSLYFIIALILLLVAAYLLFKQRSDLAYYYGQISLEISMPGYTGKSINELFEKVDAWSFWYPYFYAIAIIGCAFAEFVVLIIIALIDNHSAWLYLFLINHRVVNGIFIFLFFLLCGYIYVTNMTKEKKEKLPHYKVYTRIAVSNVHDGGVGVLAIADIPKDEYIFFPDNDHVIWVNETELENLPEGIKKLYTDFCVKKGKKYGCPISFNKLTPAWYLNSSQTPNVYCDDDLRFKALRNIKEGEELTADYSKYSED